MSRSPRTERARRSASALLFAAALGAGAGCSFDRSDRWLFRPSEPDCTPGAIRCRTELERCEDAPEGPAWTRVENCSKQGLVCSETLAACAVCDPDSLGCDGSVTTTCRSDGSGWDPGETCPE